METRPSTYELEGKVKVIEDLRTFPSGFTKREFVVTSEERFPQDVKFECIKEKTEMLDGIQVSDPVKVSFNIRGNEYNGKYYVNLQAWRIEKVEGGGGEETAGDMPAEESFPDDGEDSPF
jgi:hypothetical protein